MTTSTIAPPALGSRRAGPSFLPFLLILFVGSGCSALIYEIVWFQLLEFAVGSSAYSLAVLLGTFMGGLCLGSLLFARLVPARWHPLRTYAFLELGIGILGVLITRGMPALDRFYASIAHGGAAGMTYRALIAAICLLPPTLLMGATLPAISRWIETTPRGVAWLGFFYGGNTVGAVIGCLLAGFYLLPRYSMAQSSYVAAGINVLVAIVGLAISAAATYQAPVTSSAPALAAGTPFRRLNHATIYLAIGLSGMTALGAEVVWTRLLSLLLGPTVYTFSLILAVFLVGLGMGSSVGAMITRSGSNARVALAWCQILLAAAIGWSAYCVTNGLPNWPVDITISVSSTFNFQLDLARCAWAILPPTLLWGASFPLALAAVVSGDGTGPSTQDPARAVGKVYAANTVGAIIGALFFSLIAIKSFGSQTSQHIMMYLAGLAAFIAIIPMILPSPGFTERAIIARTINTAITVVFALAVSLGGVAILQIRIKKYPHNPNSETYALDETPGKLIAWGRNVNSYDSRNSTVETFGEGLNSSVAVTRTGTNYYFHVAGKVEASTIPEDMRLQLMLGHYPSLFHPNPEKRKKVLIVGCGAGVTAGCFRVYPHEEIVLCELEPLVPQLASAYFSTENNAVVTRDQRGNLPDRVRVVFDDARHFVLTTDDKFDIITSDPIHPWVKGAASLYTKEYFETVKAHLNPGGLVTQWVPLYESDSEAVKSEIKTFFEVFPNGSVWTNDSGGQGYDVILLGSNEPLTIDMAALDKRLQNVVISPILKTVNLDTAAAILHTFGGRASDLTPWTSTGQTNYDSNLRLQYLAGQAVNNFLATQIQSEILRYRRFPEGLLKVSDEQRDELMKAWNLKSP
jgi:spermidine synthase